MENEIKELLKTKISKLVDDVMIGKYRVSDRTGLIQRLQEMRRIIILSEKKDEAKNIG